MQQSGSCVSADFQLEDVEKACYGLRNCTIRNPSIASKGDPCHLTKKTLAAKFRCTHPDGTPALGSQVTYGQLPYVTYTTDLRGLSLAHWMDPAQMQPALTQAAANALNLPLSAVTFVGMYDHDHNVMVASADLGILSTDPFASDPTPPYYFDFVAKMEAPEDLYNVTTASGGAFLNYFCTDCMYVELYKQDVEGITPFLDYALDYSKPLRTLTATATLTITHSTSPSGSPSFTSSITDTSTASYSSTDSITVTNSNSATKSISRTSSISFSSTASKTDSPSPSSSVFLKVQTFGGAQQTTKTYGVCSETGTNKVFGTGFDKFYSYNDIAAVTKFAPASGSAQCSTFKDGQLPAVGATVNCAGTSGSVVQLAGCALSAGSGSDTPLLYVADYLGHAVRVINPATRYIYTVAGSATSTQGYLEGTGTNAKFNYPVNIAIQQSGSGGKVHSLFVIDSRNQAIRKVVVDYSSTTMSNILKASNPAGVAGVTSLFAGGGAAGPGLTANGYVDGAAIGVSKFKFFTAQPSADGGGMMVFDPDTQLWYVSDFLNACIRTIDAAGTVGTVAGTANAFAFVDGVGLNAQFYGPNGLALSGTTLFVADSYNYVIRRIDTMTWTVSTIAGIAGSNGDADGLASSVGEFNYPAQLTLEPTHGIGSDLRLLVGDRDSKSFRTVGYYFN